MTYFDDNEMWLDEPYESDGPVRRLSRTRYRLWYYRRVLGFWVFHPVRQWRNRDIPF